MTPSDPSSSISPSPATGPDASGGRSPTSAPAPAPAPAPAGQAPTSSPAAPAPVPGAAPVSRRPQALRRLLLIGLPVAALVLGIAVYLGSGRYITTDDAYVKASILTVSDDIPGLVAEVAVQENAAVRRGQLLLRLDDQPYRIALDAAQAHLAATRDDIRVLQATYRRMLADVRSARAEERYAQSDYQRLAPLLATNAATASQVDRARRDLDSASARTAALVQQAAAALADLGGAADAPIDAHPRVREAEAACRAAQRNLDHTRVLAPCDGVVSRSDNLRPGLYLTAAMPALALIASGDLWVDANPKETDLTHVRPGQPVTVSIDAYPGRTWTGSVQAISPATGSQFALLPSQNATGNWVKVVQRLGVRIQLQDAPDAPRLRAGMSATVVIDTGHERHLGDLLDEVGRWFGRSGR